MLVNGQPLWQTVAHKVANEWNDKQNCMVVVGATYPDELKQVRQQIGDMTILLPGIGMQGGEVEQAVRAGVSDSGNGLIVNASRSIIFTDDPEAAARSLRDEINLYR